MDRSRTATAGAVAGGMTGVALVVLTHPTPAYVTSSYAAGQDAGYVFRYIALGVAAAFLVRLVLQRSWTVPAALGLVALAAAAILPPALDTTTRYEQRRTSAARITDPQVRRDAQARADAIQGCTDSASARLKGVPGMGRFRVDDYCACFIDAVVAGPQDNGTQLEAMATEMRSGHVTERLTSSARACARQAQ